jgi:hypothetical protein
MVNQGTDRRMKLKLVQTHGELRRFNEIRRGLVPLDDEIW